MEPVMQLADQAAKLALALRQMATTLDGLKESLQQVCNIENNLRDSRYSLTDAEARLKSAQVQVAKCEADIRFESCSDKWTFIEKKWVEVGAGYPMLAVLCSCPD